MDETFGSVIRAFAAGLFACACSSGNDDAERGGDDPFARLPYARDVVSFTPGEGAGFGEDKLPGIVLGPPQGKGLAAGSLDVLSLGSGGEIVLGFGARSIVDGPGADLVVFENAFYAGGDPTAPFAEPGEVAVSLDGREFVAFPCNAEPDESGKYPGCAGTTPTLEYDPEELAPIVPELTGGDAFDLERLGLSEARYVRIRDLSSGGSAPSAGFDLDAIGIVNASE